MKRPPNSITAALAALLIKGLVLAPAALAVGGSNMLSAITEVASSLRLSNAPAPISVDAHHMEFDYQGGGLKFGGNVEVEHAGMTLKATSVNIEFTPGKRRSLKRVTARGNVRLARGKEKASGGLAIYDPLTATVVLSQHAILKSGPNSVSGERVIVYLDERRAVVESSPRKQGKAVPASDTRVRVVIEPDTISAADHHNVGELEAVPLTGQPVQLPGNKTAQGAVDEPAPATAPAESTNPAEPAEDSVKPSWARPTRENAK